MTEDKCFCHFGSFAVKDATAREQIRKLQENQVNIEFATDEEIDAMFEGYEDLTADSPLPVDVATAEEMNALLETAEVGSVFKYTGETTDTYENGALYIVTEE